MAVATACPVDGYDDGVGMLGTDAAGLAGFRVGTWGHDPVGSHVVHVDVECEVFAIYCSNVVPLARCRLSGRFVLVVIAVGQVVLYGHGCYGYLNTTDQMWSRKIKRMTEESVRLSFLRQRMPAECTS